MKRTKTGKNRILVWLLSAIVVTCTIMALIVPAMTLDQEKAAQQGGIDVVQEQNDPDMTAQDAASTDAEESSDENASATDKPQKDVETSDEETAPATDDTIVDTIDEAGELAFEGEGFNVSAAYDAKAGLPLDTELAVSEIGEDAEDYEALQDQALEAVRKEMGGVSDADLQLVRLYDISLMAGGAAVEPQTPVDVAISYEKALKISDAQNLRVVHFAVNKKGKIKPEVLDTEDVEITLGKHGGNGAARMKGTTFTAQSFSVYAIVDAPEPVSYGETASSVSDLTSTRGKGGFYLSVTQGKPQIYYMTSTLNNNKAFNETTNRSGAATWYFEPVAGTSDKFRIYTGTDTSRQYLAQRATNSVEMQLSASGDVFQITKNNNGTFTIKLDKEDKWLQHSGSGNGIRLYKEHNNAGNSEFTFTFITEGSHTDDAYELDGKTYGIAYCNGDISAAGMLSETKTVSNTQRLKSKTMAIRPDVVSHNGNLLVSGDTDIAEWTFESIVEDKYYITTTIDGEKKYLTINGGNVTLETVPDSHSVITATPGTESNAGKWRFTVDGYSLNLPGGNADSFNAANDSGATTWMNLVEKSDKIDDDDIKLYTARKVSVSQTYIDETTGEEKYYMPDGSKVIIYTRIWNEDLKKYELYAVDYDGTLIKCYDSGDIIQWYGSDTNTALWDFTEYHEKNGDPNYYYEFQNDYSKRYIAPQIEDGQILSKNTIGVNLNGRRNGYDYSPIIAWDEDNYQYAGLKADGDKIVSCPLDEADDFFFAIVTIPDPDDPPQDELTPVKTIDNNDFGISMRMVDFNNSIEGGRDSKQTQYFGLDSNAAGMLSTELGDDGYPKVTTMGDASLGGLFQGGDRLNPATDPVNHLFLESVYNESGYFQYDSTQNFASLDKTTGKFTVYDQLAAIGNETRPTRTHGQFMPYNSITAGKYATVTNQTDVFGKPLPETDPRKGEKLYLIDQTKADYFFGMELEAQFTQTENGKDAWGHDIIFEFTGDDDFWFYVDGELVLDLGGVHSASEGKVNFRTGEVEYTVRDAKGNIVASRTGHTTLYDLFKQNYMKKTGKTDPNDPDVLNYLAGIFDNKGTEEDPQYVFKDLTTHSMKIFFMERGAGASNLKMRFNLASVEPGTVMLSKQISGAESQSYDLAEFPYQIRYLVAELDEAGHPKTDADGRPLTTEHILKPDEEKGIKVLYADTNKDVPYQESFTTADGISYHDVFMLKAGETAQITFPENTVSYAVVECGVNTDVFDKVEINLLEAAGGTINELTPDPDPDTATYHDPETPVVDTNGTYGDKSRKDFGINYADLNERPRVNYDNHVRPGALRTMSFTKKLYDVDGTTPLHYPANDTLFSFRLYLGSENADSNDLPLADMHRYCVRDGSEEKNYCRWDASIKKFVSIGKNDYDSLTKEEKKAITFTTSMNGAISKIPADYTVEVRDLIITTQYKVEERDREIPKGYTRRDADGYTRTDVSPVESQSQPYANIIGKDEDPKIEVRNQKGWGLTAEKIWTDSDFMELHDDIFFAVYLGEPGSDNQPIEGTVRRLSSDESEIYYFFDDLYDEQQNPHSFSEYTIREVEVKKTGPGELVIDSDGIVEVTDDVTVTPIAPNGTLSIGGQPKGDIYHPSGPDDHGYNYTVSYAVGSPTGHNENVRVDTVTNSRPGIRFIKTDWSGDKLPGAVFELKESGGEGTASSEFTSRSSDGQITTAYLREGMYTLTETAAPEGYTAIPEGISIQIERDVQFDRDKITFKLGDDVITVPADPDDEIIGLSPYLSVERPDPSMLATVKIKDRSSGLQVRKVEPSATSESPLQGVHFALYRQVKDASGNLVKDHVPITGYDDLVTNANGIPVQVVGENEHRITMGIGPDTYYLEETSTIEGYNPLPEDLCFTIGKDGTVSINTEQYKNWLSEDEEAGIVNYTITIPNSKTKKVSIWKTDTNYDTITSGASFALYREEDFDDTQGKPVAGKEPIKSGTTGENGILSLDDLEIGNYCLVETEAPAGYDLIDSAISISVTATGVTAIQAGNNSEVVTKTDDPYHHWVEGQDKDTYQINVWNNPGVELPESGGPGTTLIYLIGSILLLGCGTILVARRRMNRFN